MDSIGNAGCFFGCSICLEEFKVGDKVAHSDPSTSKCGCTYHEECIVSWLVTRKSCSLCPCCRQTFVAIPGTPGFSSGTTVTSPSVHDGTSLSGSIVLPSGKEVDADEAQEPIDDEIYYIVPDKCTECKGFHEEPQCAAVCPVDCCVPDDDNVETEEELLGKQRFMHPED